jgi:hypothetical protein
MQQKCQLCFIEYRFVIDLLDSLTWLLKKITRVLGYHGSLFGTEAGARLKARLSTQKFKDNICGLCSGSRFKSSFWDSS